MKVNKTLEYVFTKEEVENILISHIQEQTDSNSIGAVATWKIREGDRGIKDPMDYSPYQPTEVNYVTVTI